MGSAWMAATLIVSFGADMVLGWIPVSGASEVPVAGRVGREIMEMSVLEESGS